MPASWRKYKNYVFVLPLCAAALFYQIVYSYVAVTTALRPNSLPEISFLSADGRAINGTKAAQAAGLHPGDRILSIDGKVPKDEYDVYAGLEHHKPGDFVTVTEATPQNGSRTLHIPVVPISSTTPTIGSIVFTATLALIFFFCVSIGIYVAVRRPQDKRALLAFSLIVSLANVLNLSDWFRFPEPLWTFAQAWRLACILNWSVAIAAFGLYFPEQFAWDLKRPWLKWLFLGPLIATNLFLLVLGMVPAFSFQEFSRLEGFEWLLNNLPQLLIAISITLFFALIGMRQGMPGSPDAKRRLRLLEVGAAVGLGPVGLLLLYEVVIRRPEESLPQAIPITVSVLFVVFPLALAYTVLTERAMDLRVAIRQGVRYTLARGGLRVLFVCIGIAFFTALSTYLFQPGVSDTKKAIGMTVGASAFAVLIRRARSQMFVAVDKKFFREHYESEALLSELSENVRTIVDERELLQTVSRQVTDALHVSHLSVLMSDNTGFRPVYSLGLAVSEQAELPNGAETLSLVQNAKYPTPIYFDRPDNWVHSAPKEEILTLKSLGAQLLLPLKAKDKLLGVFCLGPKLSEEPFSKTDINLLRSVAIQTGLALDNSRLTAAFAQEVAQRERLNREIEIAREVQERLFPQKMPLIAGIDYSGSCRPALGVGGDYYDFLQLPNGDLGVAVGDVSGKGIAAALLMASLQASLRSQALTGTADLAQLMCNVNKLVYDATPSNRYATFFYGQYQQQTRTFRYVNAGHNPPFILRRSSDGTVHVIRLETGGPVVGLFSDAPYQQGSLILERGDVFVGFTDGISEAMNCADEEWGEENLIPSAAAQLDKPACEMIPELMADADRFVSGAPQHDDMTLVVVKMLG